MIEHNTELNTTLNNTELNTTLNNTEQNDKVHIIFICQTVRIVASMIVDSSRKLNLYRINLIIIQYPIYILQASQYCSDACHNSFLQ